MSDKPDTYTLYECRGGGRFSIPTGSAINRDATGEPCTFSGCNCGGKVYRAAAGASREAARSWSRFPNPVLFRSVVDVLRPDQLHENARQTSEVEKITRAKGGR